MASWDNLGSQFRTPGQWNTGGGGSFLNTPGFLNEVFGQKPEMALYGNLSKLPGYQQNLLRNRSGDIMKQFYGSAGRSLMEGMPSPTPQDYFGNFDFQREMFDMPRFNRGASTNFLNPRARFLYGF